MRSRRFGSIVLTGALALAALGTAPAAVAGPVAPAGPAAVEGPVVVGGPAAVEGPSVAAAADGSRHRVEVFAEDGSIGRATVPAASPYLTGDRPGLAPAAGDGEVTPILRSGDSAAKVDVVVIGDGYTAAEQEKFRADATAKWQELSAVEPYAAYRNLFNVWAVATVSAESGITGDPDRATVRNTALGSYFWCEDIERLLCVDTKAVETYAVKAPQADLVLVVANTAKYGGAGYNVASPLGYDGIATVAGGNPKAGQIAVHETGHSLGKLADEYFYDGSDAYPAEEGEPAEPNISMYTADRLTHDRAKWYRWIGRTSPDGGVVGSYEGGGYYPKGLYRPTENSIMRSLGREFNLPGREAMIAGFYRHAVPLTSPTPAGTPLTRSDRLTVGLPVAGTTLSWSLDGRTLPQLRGRTTVDLRTVPLPGPRGRTHTLTATATDPTPAVLDPALRAALTASLSWPVTH
ncbi:M64 family metallopeptidase [Kitasatospora sp. NPDC089913]|uniref:M64 family metallopeptidase n=1 Tax=Kitasatospora sp. NPDC089913 TaxID=3364080 RepID=UPI003829824D